MSAPAESSREMPLCCLNRIALRAPAAWHTHVHINTHHFCRRDKLDTYSRLGGVLSRHTSQCRARPFPAS